jgi:putative flavoprotein involved in K+ transport
MEPVIIIGAGPSGLAVGACLKRLDIPFTLLDRTGRAGGSFHQMDRNLKLLSPRRYVSLPNFRYPGNEDYPSMPDYENYLEEYARHFGLSAKLEEVTEIRRIPNGFEVQCISASTLSCQFLVVASGLFGHPVWPEIQGLADAKGTPEAPVILHAGDWAGVNAFAGRRILIIGAGISGVGIAEECARSGLPVLVSHRLKQVRLLRPRLFGLDILYWFRPLEFLPRGFFGSRCQLGFHAPAYDNGYNVFEKEGKIVELPEVKQVQGRKVWIADGSHHEVDVIVVATGYRYETPFLPPEVHRMPGGHPMADDCESPDWPGLFFVGAPCSRRINSEFLRGIASDAIFVANRIRRRLC